MENNGNNNNNNNNNKLVGFNILSCDINDTHL